jgi:hypothetical protein
MKINTLNTIKVNLMNTTTEDNAVSAKMEEPMKTMRVIHWTAPKFGDIIAKDGVPAMEVTNHLHPEGKKVMGNWAVPANANLDAFWAAYITKKHSSSAVQVIADVPISTIKVMKEGFPIKFNLDRCDDPVIFRELAELMMDYDNGLICSEGIKHEWIVEVNYAVEIYKPEIMLAREIRKSPPFRDWKPTGLDWEGGCPACSRVGEYLFEGYAERVGLDDDHSLRLNRSIDTKDDKFHILDLFACEIVKVY